MPTCRDMSELVTDYLERALPLRTWLGARWHLFLCPACRRYYEQMRQTIRLLAGRRAAAARSGRRGRHARKPARRGGAPAPLTRRPAAKKSRLGD